MSKGEIKVTISPDGKPKIEVNGVKGGSCKGITEALEKSLGMVETFKKKPEFDQSEGCHTKTVTQ